MLICVLDAMFSLLRGTTLIFTHVYQGALYDIRIRSIRQTMTAQSHVLKMNLLLSCAIISDKCIAPVIGQELITPSQQQLSSSKQGMITDLC